MIKELTNIEVAKSTNNQTYVKLWFNNQYFLVTPWHYKSAGLHKILESSLSCVVGEQYDIKWRDAKFKGRKITLLTKLEMVETKEFEWIGEEQSKEDNYFPQFPNDNDEIPF